MLSVSAAGLALGLVACGGGGDKASGGDRPRPTRTAPSTVPTTGGGAESPTTTVPAGGDVSALLADLAALSSSRFRVDYATTGAIGSATTYWANPKARGDTTYQGLQYRGYADASTGAATGCVKTGPRWTCQSAQATSWPGVPPVLDASTMSGELERALRVPGVTTSTRTIAGQAADCATVPATSTTAAQDFCLAKSGALLSYSGSLDGAPYTLTATGYTTEVSDADFVPPA